MSSASSPNLLLIKRNCQPLEPRLTTLADAILLTQDALYLLCQPGFDAWAEDFDSIYGLTTDAQARGLALSDKLIWLDYADWVELSLNAKQVIPT